jgi:hypothetical protein
MIFQVLGMLMGNEPDPTVHQRGETTNYASYEYRKSLREGQRINRAKSPHGISMGGVNRSAYLAGGSGTSQSEPQYTSKTYPLGKPSQALWDKYGKWGEHGPQGNKGWLATLTNAPPSQSTAPPTQMFKNEVFQTRETRTRSGATPYQMLRQHPNTPRLNPNLAYMYKAKNSQLGAVRRTVTRFL